MLFRSVSFLETNLQRDEALVFPSSAVSCLALPTPGRRRCHRIMYTRLRTPMSACDEARQKISRGQGDARTPAPATRRGRRRGDARTPAPPHEVLLTSRRTAGDYKITPRRAAASLKNRRRAEPPHRRRIDERAAPPEIDLEKKLRRSMYTLVKTIAKYKYVYV